MQTKTQSHTLLGSFLDSEYPMIILKVNVYKESHYMSHSVDLENITMNSPIKTKKHTSARGVHCPQLEDTMPGTVAEVQGNSDPSVCMFRP